MSRVRSGRAVRLAAALALAAALLAGLAGCMRLHFGFTVNPDDTVAVTTLLAYEGSILEEAAQAKGQTVEEFLAESGVDKQLQRLGGRATVEDYRADGYTGWVITGEELDPLGAVTVPGQLGRAGTLELSREGDSFVLAGEIDVQQLPGDLSAWGADTPEAQAMLKDIDFQFAFTFPGPVTSASGAVDGNTVTFAPKWGEPLEVHAVASAIPAVAPAPGSPSGISPWLIVAVVLVLAVAVLLAWRSASRRRKTAARTAASDPGQPAEGFGPLPAAPGAGARAYQEPGSGHNDSESSRESPC
jgi:hypothetical protein